MAHPADAGARAHVFVEQLGDLVEVGGEDGHHLSRVLRLRAGQMVTAADGRGCWRAYVVTALTKTGLSMEATGGPTQDREPAVRLAVAFALTKGVKPELTIQKLTELGADRILPVLAGRSVARPPEERAAADLVRWQRVALEAAKQCRRPRLPLVEALAPLAALEGHPAVVVADRGGMEVSAIPVPPGDEVLGAVGPEGGWAAGEIDRLRPFATVTLGANVLRAETAALALAAGLAARYRES